MKKKNPEKAPRRQGAGTVEPLPSGAYRVRVTAGGRRVSKVVPTLAEAEELRRALVQEREALARERVTDAPAVETLDTWGASWMARRAATGAVRWPKVDAGRWRTHVTGTPLASKPLAEVRARDVRQWLAGMMEKRADDGAPLTRQTVIRGFALVRKALADAAADERIAANPAAGLKVPKRAERCDDDPWTFLTADEVRAVEGCEAIPEGLRLLFTVAIRTGLRAGELWALRWGAVELEGAAPVVVVRASHRGAPKNGKVQRVPLLPAARAAFERLRELAGDVAADDLVFPSATGRQRPRGDDARWMPEAGGKGKPPRWRGYRAVAGIARDVRFHDLRHTFASHLVMGTWTAAPLPLAEVRTLMRHGSVAMTERYVHLAPEHLHARIAAAPPALHEAPPAPAPTAPAPPAGVDSRVDNCPPLRLSTPLPALRETPWFQGGSCGDRTHDRRIKSPCGIEAFPRGNEGPWTARGQLAGAEGDVEAALRGAAAELLRAVDEGTPAGPVARELAVQALRALAPDSPGWALAVAVLEGGPLRARRAVDLAGLVLDGAERQQGADRAAG